MSFCSLTNDSRKNFTTQIENQFITDYLAESDGDAVKVYVYGLFLCKNQVEDVDIYKFAEALCLSVDTVKDCFKYWEDFDLVSILSDEPFTVKYLPITNHGKARKFKSGKYDDFSKALQVLVNNSRMISTNEYADYFTLMEDYNVKPEALLMICQYCIKLKGESVGGKYILAVAKDFLSRGITTVSLIEDELNEYNNRSSDVQKVLTAMKLKRTADIDDFNHFNKWTKDLLFTTESIIFVVSTYKIKTVLRLDEVLMELYSAKAFSKPEITDYFDKKLKTETLAKTVARELSVYCQVLSPVVEGYINPWLALGFESDALEFIAKFCFKSGKKSFEDMNLIVEKLYKEGRVSVNNILDYFKKRALDDDFIKKILETSFVDRLPNEWDRKNLFSWREWGFSDEMILEAAIRSQGKSNVIVYMNTILSNWKSTGIFTVDKIPSYEKPKDSTSPVGIHTQNERKYTKEELDSLIDDVSKINF